MHLVHQRSFGPVRSWELGFAPVGTPMMTVRMYYLDGLLIDTGQSHMRQASLAALAELPVHQVLLSHHHEDHSGNAAAIARQRAAPVLAHPLAARKLRGGFRILPYQRWFWGSAEPARVEPLSGAVESDRYRLTPVLTPGHSKDHVVFHEERQGWLFSGDLFLGERIKFFRADERMDDQIRSLEKVVALDFDVLFCAHNPRLRGGKASLARKLDFLRNLRGEAVALHQQGLPVGEVIDRLDPRRDRRIRWITLGNVSFAHMVRSALRGRAELA